VTRAPGEAVSLAQQASASHDVVFAAGGDGTVHEVVNGLLRGAGKAALGVIPLGSGDDFAKLLAGQKGFRSVDAGRIVSGAETRYFANGMDIGFGAHGAANVQRVPRFLKGFSAYLGALFLTMVRYPLLRVRLQLDDDPPRELVTAMTAVMNGTTFGGSFRVTPEARPDDGLLDLLVVDAVGRLAILQLVPKILKGIHAGDPRVKLMRARRVVIESPEPLLVEADGEIAFADARRLQVEALPGALRVLG
jgi:diacylglycerol kinase (ATP)